jgi:cytochrome P450
MYHLLLNTDQYDALRADVSLVPNTVDEVLRFDVSARNTMPRWAVRDTTIGATPIPKGEQVFGIFGAAHRDPARFVDPHRFDIRREDVGHLAFGFGVHYCLGARLARLELVTALTLLAADFPRMSLVTEDVRWRDVLILRALERLEVAW